jgi:hypothetical protein
MSKLLRISIVILFVLGVVMIASPAAAEKWKWNGTSFTTEVQKMDVGDEEGHVLMISKAQQLYVNETTGAKWTGPSVSTMDINPKSMKMTLRGYGVIVDEDGDKLIRTHEGKIVGKNQWAGTYTYTSGTGKFEGIKGGGTFTMYSMGQGQPAYIEAEADVEIPAK